MSATSGSAPRRDSANVATVHERLRTAILRGELEPGAIIPQGTLALASSDSADLEGFLAQMDHYQKAGDQAGFRAPHHAFHHRLIAGSGPRVSTQIDELADYSERYRLRFGDSMGWREYRNEHRQILDAAAARDADLAAEQLAAHYARIAALVFKALDPEHDPDRLRCAIEAVTPGAAAALHRQTSTSK